MTDLPHELVVFRDEFLRVNGSLVLVHLVKCIEMAQGCNGRWLVEILGLWDGAVVGIQTLNLQKVARKHLVSHNHICVDSIGYARRCICIARATNLVIGSGCVRVDEMDLVVLGVVDKGASHGAAKLTLPLNIDRRTRIILREAPIAATGCLIATSRKHGLPHPEG